MRPYTPPAKRKGPISNSGNTSQEGTNLPRRENGKKTEKKRKEKNKEKILGGEGLGAGRSMLSEITMEGQSQVGIQFNEFNGFNL